MVASGSLPHLREGKVVGDGVELYVRQVGDLERIRAWCGFESIAVLGHSWGGLLALEYALAHPDRVSHLVLMNTAPASHGGVVELRAELAQRRSAEQTARMAELRSSPAFLAGDFGAEAEYYRIHYGTTLRDAELLDTVIGRLRTAFTAPSVLAARVIEDGLYDDSWSRADDDLIPLLGQLDVPTLVMHGDDDFVPISVVHQIVDALPRARLVVIPDCGHFSYLEQPDRAIETIATFLTKPGL